MTIALRHRLQLPTDWTLMAKVIAMSEGLGAQLDPEFKLMEFAQPYFERFWLQSHSPRAQAYRIAEGALDLIDLGIDLPRRFGRLLGQLERGEITVVSRLEELEEILGELHRATNRQTVSTLTAALIIGLGLLMLVYHPPRLGAIRGLGIWAAVRGGHALRPGATVVYLAVGSFIDGSYQPRNFRVYFLCDMRSEVRRFIRTKALKKGEK